jgi:hypothetical protein
MAVEEVTFVGTTLAGVQENVVHFYNPDGAATHAAIAADLQTNWINPLLNLHNNNFTWVSMNIRTVDPTGGVTSTHPVSPGQGNQSGDMPPPFVSALIRLSSATPGRSGRGRIYIPGLSIGTFGDRGRLTPGSYAAFQTIFLNGWRTHYLNPSGTSPVTLCIIPRSDPTDKKLVTALDVRLWASVQRRRNYFIGI